MSIRPQIRALAPYDFTPHPEGVKLDQNELPEDLPEELKSEFLQRLERVALNRYPDLTAVALQRSLARLHDWPEEGVVVATGSNVLIQHLVIAAGIGQRVVVPTPTFSVYGMQARILGATLAEVPSGPGFALPVEGMLAAMREASGLVFVANPAAPTGNLHSRNDLERLVSAAGERWLVVIDEAYSQFSGTDFSDLARTQPVVSLRTLSKAFGLAGARLGYALTTPEIARELRKIGLPFAVSALQQAAAQTVLAHPELVAARVRAVLAERDRLAEELGHLAGVTVYPSVTNFLLLRVEGAARVHGQLLDRGVVVRRQSGPVLDGHLRVSVGTREENDRFLAALEQALSEVGSV